MLIINPKYNHLRTWLEALPHTFSQTGEVIYDARNQIRVIEGPDGHLYNVKRYCKPKWYNQLIYSWIRSPKAKRAFHNAFVLRSHNIDTPEPIGYILCGKNILTESFLITVQIPFTHRLYEWGDGNTIGREKLMIAFGRFSGKMHNQGILHLDYSPGNILYENINGVWHFSVVDINRMSLGNISMKQGCKSLARLWGGKSMYELIAQGYAQERNMSTQQCFQWMWNAHLKFWNRHPIPHAIQMQ